MSSNRIAPQNDSDFRRSTLGKPALGDRLAFQNPSMSKRDSVRKQSTRVRIAKAKPWLHWHEIKEHSNANRGNEAKGGGACDDSPWRSLSGGGEVVYGGLPAPAQSGRAGPASAVLPVNEMMQLTAFFAIDTSAESRQAIPDE